MKIRTNETILMLAVTLFAEAILGGCSDSVTKITTPDVQMVATYKDLDECSDKNDGDLYYVKDSGSVFICSGNIWKKTGTASLNGTDGENGSDGKNGFDGKDGSDGKDGTSCTVSALKDSSGFDILCGGEKVGTLLNGKDGAKGDKGGDGVKGDNGDKGDNGKPGSTCSAKELSDGVGYELSCDGKVVGTIKNGTKGEKGDEGAVCVTKVLEDGSGYELSCDGKVVGTLKNGTSVDAKCSFYDYNGIVSIECDNEEPFRLPLALCGSTPYNPKTKICFDGELYNR